MGAIEYRVENCNYLKYVERNVNYRENPCCGPRRNLNQICDDIAASISYIIEIEGRDGDIKQRYVHHDVTKCNVDEQRIATFGEFVLLERYDGQNAKVNVQEDTESRYDAFN